MNWQRVVGAMLIAPTALVIILTITGLFWNFPLLAIPCAMFFMGAYGFFLWDEGSELVARKKKKR